MLDNLDTLMRGLNDGLKPEQVATFGFVHHEPHGVLAVDQKGGAKLAETRLYIYLDKEALTVYPITLGDKKSQKGDIEVCAAFMNQMRKQTQRGAEHEQAKTLQ